uniref:Uncharacterized protein n=1 Tax=Triticum urartu TaxID=4572 RepID=A0A8R7Q1N3_TRIUA
MDIYLNLEYTDVPGPSPSFEDKLADCKPPFSLLIVMAVCCDHGENIPITSTVLVLIWICSPSGIIPQVSTGPCHFT